MIVQLLRDQFAGRYDVDTATSAHQTVEMFAGRHPDAVFLDMTMPEVDGLTLLKFVRQVDPDVAVIVVTADSSRPVAPRCADCSQGASRPVRDQLPTRQQAQASLLFRLTRRPPPCEETIQRGPSGAQSDRQRRIARQLALEGLRTGTIPRLARSRSNIAATEPRSSSTRTFGS